VERWSLVAHDIARRDVAAPWVRAQVCVGGRDSVFRANRNRRRRVLGEENGLALQEVCGLVLARVNRERRLVTKEQSNSAN